MVNGGKMKAVSINNPKCMKIPPPTLDTPNWPAAACAGAYVAPVEREARLGNLAKPSPLVPVGH